MNGELRLEREGMADRVGRGAEFLGRAFQSVEIDSVGADFFQQLRKHGGGGRAFVARAVIPGKNWKHDAHAAAVKLLDDLAQRGKSSRQIAQQVELVAVVHAEVRIHRPNQHCVNRTDAPLEVREKNVHGVLAFFGVVERAVPHEQLALGEDALRPGEFRTLVERALVMIFSQAIFAPLLDSGAPFFRFLGSFWAREETRSRAQREPPNPARREARPSRDAPSIRPEKQRTRKVIAEDMQRAVCDAICGAASSRTSW